MTRLVRCQASLFALLLIFATQIAYSETTNLSVTTNAATAITGYSAELHGVLITGGVTATGAFEWGTTNSLSQTTVQPFSAGTATIPFSQSLRNLLPNTTYYFRAIGYRSDIRVNGEIKTFTTSGAAALANVVVTTGAAAAATSNSATLNGTINPGGAATSAWFNWGPTMFMGTRSDVQTFNGSSAVAVTQTLKNLQPHTTYYFRLEASRPYDGYSSAGEEKAFTTNSESSDAVSITACAASEIASTSAMLIAVVNTGANSGTGWFEWGTSSAVTNQSEVQALGAGTGLSVALSLKNLQPHTTYYFRSAVNAAGATVRSELKNFTTSAESAGPLAVTTNSASAVSGTSAELRGIVDTGGAAATAWFEWGTSTTLTSQTDAQTVGSGTPANFAQSVTDLQPNTAYYFRAVARNSTGTVQGEVKTFTALHVPSTVPEAISEVEQGSIRSGYLIITPDSNSAVPMPTVTFGTVSQGSVQSQAGIVPTLMTTDASMFVEIIPSIGRRVGVAFANPGDAVNAITLTLYDESGIILGTPVVVSVPGHQQLSKFLNELFGADIVDAGLRGSVRMKSGSPFAAIGFRFAGPVFSTLPVEVLRGVPGVPSTTLTAGAAPNTPQPGKVGGPTALIIPQFAMSGSWATQIALVNISGVTVTGRLDVFDANGNPMGVTLNGEARSTFTYSIPAGGTLVLAPRDSHGQSPL